MQSIAQIETPPHDRNATEQMRAAVLAEPRRIEIRNVPIPRPADGEVRVRVEYCGICSSNLSPWAGAPWFSYPFPPGAPGHEASGFVEEIGVGVSNLRIGERVATLANQAFAEQLVARAENVVSISRLPSQSLFLGEPLGCAVNIFKRAQIRKGDWVAIVGMGFLGAILLQLCLREGAQVIAISRRPFALRIATKLGAEHALEMTGRPSVVTDIRRITSEHLCDVVIEAGGVQPTLDLAGDLCRTRGRLVIAGYHQNGPRMVNMQHWNWNGLDVINAHERDELIYIQGIQQAADMVARGAIHLEGLITRTFPIRQIEEGFRLAEERPEGFMKGIVAFG
jgi:threonine dehydrogenase-like Zn-dependent dehydrogenase